MSLPANAPASTDEGITLSGSADASHVRRGLAFDWLLLVAPHGNGGGVMLQLTLTVAGEPLTAGELALKEGLFYRDLLFDLGIITFNHGPSTVYLDSKSAIDLSLDPVAFKKTKHIMRACFFARGDMECYDGAIVTLRTRHPTRGHGNTDERTKRRASFRQSLAQFCELYRRGFYGDPNRPF